MSSKALSRLAWLCDARVHHLKKCLRYHTENYDLSEDEISDAENDITYFEGMAAQLRSAR